MDGISSLTFLPSTTKSGTKKSLGDKIVSLTRDRMASLALNLLFLLNGYMCQCSVCSVQYAVFGNQYLVCSSQFALIFFLREKFINIVPFYNTGDSNSIVLV